METFCRLLYVYTKCLKSIRFTACNVRNYILTDLFGGLAVCLCAEHADVADVTEDDVIDDAERHASLDGRPERPHVGATADRVRDHSPVLNTQHTHTVITVPSLTHRPHAQRCKCIVHEVTST